MTDAHHPTDPQRHTAPDEILRRADALVFVESLDAPELEHEDDHHLRDVLRLRVDAAVIAADGRGAYRSCRFEPRPTGRGAPSSQTASRLIADGPVTDAFQHPPLAVAFTLLKGDRNDWIVQKLTELGIDRITPITSERCIVRLDAAGLQKRAVRFRRIAREAAAQARRPRLPEIDDPVTFADAAGLLVDGALAEPGGGPLRPDVRSVLIGPEGGWSDDELTCALPRIGLGPTVLRAETAAIAAASRLTAVRT